METGMTNRMHFMPPFVRFADGRRVSFILEIFIPFSRVFRLGNPYPLDAYTCHTWCILRKSVGLS